MHEILHLYWRAGFGLSPREWKEKKKWSRKKAINQLFSEAKYIQTLEAGETPTFNPQMKEEALKAMRQKERRMVALQNIDWLKRMGSSNHSPLLERMSLFWHGHFACKTRLSKLASQQLNTIRQHALGNFRGLLLAIAKDVSMIRFLNNQQNKKQKPNENFARELLELFTIGRGHYSEQDIKEAARAFTGWSSNLKGEFVFRKFQHDYGQKTFFGKTGNFDGGDIIDIVLEKRETANFICQKVYRYFVNEKLNQKHVAELTDVFYNSDYDIEKLMRHIFSSDWFYAKENVGSKIKSPVELMAGILKTLNVDFKNDMALIFVQKALGQVLFSPPNVAGWAGGKSWIDNSTLMLRLNLAAYLLNSGDVNFKLKDDLKAQRGNKAFRKLTAEVNLTPIRESFRNHSNQNLFEELSSGLLQVKPSIDNQFVNQVSKAVGTDDHLKMILLSLMSLPEYQMC